MIINCFKVDNQPKQQQLTKFLYNQQTNQFILNDQTIKIQQPIGLQKFQNYFYTYLNPSTTITIHNNHYQQLTNLLQKNNIAYLKVPDQQTQILAQQHRIQQYKNNAGMEGSLLVHCGSYNYVQDCFIVVREKQLEVRDGNDKILQFCKNCSVQYDNQFKCIRLEGGNCFYFWKNFQFLEAKSIILESKVMKQGQNDVEINFEIIDEEQLVRQGKIEIKDQVQNKIQEQVQQQDKMQGKLNMKNKQVAQIQVFVQIQQQQQQNNKIQAEDKILVQNNNMQQQQNFNFQLRQQPRKQLICQQNVQNKTPNKASQINQKEAFIQNENYAQKQNFVDNQDNQNKSQMEPQASAQVQVQVQVKQQIKQQPSDSNSESQQQQSQSKLGSLPKQKHIKKQQKSSTKKFTRQSTTTAKKQKQPLLLQTETKPKISHQPQNNQMIQQKQNLFVTPAKQNQNQQHQNMHAREQIDPSSANQSQMKPFLQTLLKNALEIYQVSQYQIQLCCMNGTDVLDIRSRDGKQYLYYHKFQESQEDGVARSTELCELKFLDEEGDGQEHQIKASKLVFDVQTNSAYFNNMNFGYLHSYNLAKGVIESHYVGKPVVDIASHLNGSILAIHDNQIFQFNTEKKKKINVAKYKTVSNLNKISSVFGQFYYATASDDGYVRTYDLRTYEKAINKFSMPQGITSLQVSSSGDYILVRYGNKAQILSCVGKHNNSVFQSRLLISDRKNAKKLIKGYQHLSHIQFINGSQHEGDIIAIDDQKDCRLAVKNIQLNSSNKYYDLKYAGENIQFLSEADKWIVYAVQGKYYRQNLLKK